jgi:hypothetical protein
MNQDNNSPWQYKPDGDGEAAEALDDTIDSPKPKKSDKSLAWEAPEFVEHHHGSNWYMAITFLLAAVAWLQDKVASIIIIVLGFIVWLYARQKPAQASYEISDDGLKVNDKTYKYRDFKSFAIIREGQLSSVNLFPLKRFMPPVSAYFEPDNEKKITESLGNYLPYEDRQLDGIDRLTRRLRL